jgi:transposase
VVSRPWIAGDQAQTALLPVNPADLLPPGHAAFEFQALADELDLSRFEAAYRGDGRGRPPFDPKVMLTLILYCRSKGLRSSRQVAASCYDDLGARVITGNQHPDRSTIDRFLVVHAASIKALLPATLGLGQAEALLDVSVVAGDGTYLQANAAMSATVQEAELAGQITELEAQLGAAQAAWAEQVAGEVEQPSLLPEADPGPPASPAGRAPAATTWRRVCTLANLLRSRREALAYLQAHPGSALKDWQDRLERDQQRVARCAQRLEQTHAQLQAAADRRGAAEAAGVKIPGTRPVPVAQNAHLRQARKALETATARAQATAASPPSAGRINTTDPTSALMPGKNAGFDQRHNIQALAGKGQFVIAIGTHDSSNDKQALVSLIQAGRANLDAAGITDPIGTALFDAGYASAANFTTELPVELLLVAIEKEARQTGRQQDDTTTTTTGGIPAGWQIMTERLDDPHNRALYKQRAAIIEPLFAQLFTRFGRDLLARGEQVEVELHLWAVTHNLLKISRHRRRRRGD